MLISPIKVFVCYAIPALFADGYFFSFDDNVEFDVFVFALVFPRIFTVLQYC